MTEEQDKTAGGRWFRLPKLFAETQDHVADAEETARSLGVDVGVGEAKTPAAAPTIGNAAEAVAARYAPPVPLLAPPPVSAPAAAPAMAEPAVASLGTSQMVSAAAVVTEIDALRGAMEQMYYIVSQINERETTQEKVFNVLHDELRGYKTDFIYEHLKPLVRSLLFLYDSLEQFDMEVQQFERPAEQERRGELSPGIVRENVGFFREQLLESLRMCEVVVMDQPQGQFNPRLHKAVEVVPVPAALDNTIQRVVRSGWLLNGQLLRPAEIVLGKFQ